MILNVLGAEYTVKIERMSKSTYGDCDTDKKVIRLNNRKELSAETLLHEVLHAALHESGVGFLLHQEGLEEAVVRAIEHGLRTAELIPEVPIEPEPEGHHE